MKKKLVTSLCLLVVASTLLAGCGSATTESYDSLSTTSSDYSVETYTISAEDIENTKTNSNYGDKLIYTYSVNVETTDYDYFVQRINDYVFMIDGYIESSDYYKSDTTNLRTLYINIRVPSDMRGNMLASLEDGGNVTKVNVSTDDVTLSYVDIESRMKTYQSEIDELDKLAEQTTDVDELLRIHEQMLDIQSDIDSYQSQLNVMDNKVDYSTFDVKISEVTTYDYETTVSSEIKENWSDSVRDIKGALVKFVTRGPVWIIYILMLAIPVALIIFLFKYISRKINHSLDKSEMTKTNRRQQTYQNIPHNYNHMNNVPQNYSQPNNNPPSNNPPNSACDKH
jgi:hypothetical protein